MRHISAAALAVITAAVPASAQTWRTIDASHQLRDTAAVAARIDYAAGKLELEPASTSALYHATVRYDADRAEPVAAFDPAGRVVSIGVHLRGTHMTNVDDEQDAW